MKRWTPIRMIVFLAFMSICTFANSNFNKRVNLSGENIGVLTPVERSNQGPIRQFEGNPHYFFFRGKPITLMTVGEHYSSLVNRNFPYEVYFDKLQQYGLNQTRIFSGSYVGPADKGSPLVFNGNRSFIAPWKWSKEQGGHYGLKFDLNKWNPEYFKRLRDVLTSASKRDIVVEMVLFCSYYEDSDWKATPFNPENNIQGVGQLEHAHKSLTLANEKLVDYQKKLVRKIISECRDFDNVYFEIANEPYWSHRGGVTPEERGAWHNVMINEALKAESHLPSNRRHMIAVNDAHASVHIADVSIINFHYITSGGFIGGIGGLKKFYHSGKALMLDETEFLKTHRVPRYNANDARVEAWEFMIGGGSGYGNLALTSYGVKNPTADTPHADSLRVEIGNLKKLIEGLNLSQTHRDTTVLAGGIPSHIQSASLSSENKKYILYFHTGQQIKKPAYTTFPGKFTVSPQLKLPSGKYTAKWINPYDLTTIKTVEIIVGKESIVLNSPEFAIDIFIEVERIAN